MCTSERWKIFSLLYFQLHLFISDSVTFCITLLRPVAVRFERRRFQCKSQFALGSLTSSSPLVCRLSQLSNSHDHSLPPLARRFLNRILQVRKSFQHKTNTISQFSSGNLIENETHEETSRTGSLQNVLDLWPRWRAIDFQFRSDYAPLWYRSMLCHD